MVIGDARVLELGMRDAGVAAALHARTGASTTCDWPRDDIRSSTSATSIPRNSSAAKSSAESGKLTGDTLKTMIDLALAGKLDGICFAPLNKGAMNRGGWKFPDEHQMFAKLTGHSGFFGEMNVIKEFSTFRVTSHVALREAVNMITPERISAAIRLAARHAARRRVRRRRASAWPRSTRTTARTACSATRKSASSARPSTNMRAGGRQLQRPDFVGRHFPQGAATANSTAW